MEDRVFDSDGEKICAYVTTRDYNQSELTVSIFPRSTNRKRGPFFIYVNNSNCKCITVKKKNHGTLRFLGYERYDLQLQRID